MMLPRTGSREPRKYSTSTMASSGMSSRMPFAGSHSGHQVLVRDLHHAGLEHADEEPARDRQRDGGQVADQCRGQGGDDEQA